MKQLITFVLCLLATLSIAQTTPTSFTIERSTNGTTYTPIGTTSGTTYTATGLTPATPYWFRVRGSNGTVATTSPYASVTVTTPGSIPVLSAPTNVSVSAISSSGLGVSWTASANATVYTVRYSTSSSMTSPVSQTTSATSLNLTGLTASTQYYVDISASAPGYTSSSATTPVAGTTLSSTAFTVTRIIRFQNMLSTFTVPVTGNINQLKPTSAQITTSALGYTSQSLLTETGTASGITLSITAPFAQVSGSLSTSAVTGSLYPLDVYKGGWQVNATTSGQVTFNGLDPTEKYRLLLYAVSGTSTGSTAFTINGVTQEKAVNNNFGVSQGNELDPNGALVEFKNIVPDGSNVITLTVSRGGTVGVGSALVPWNMGLIEEYTGNRP